MSGLKLTKETPAREWYAWYGFGVSNHDFYGENERETSGLNNI